MKTDILKVIVGSQAHGLADEKSDYDYRGVYVVPTIEFFRIGEKLVQHTSWIEGKEDDTSWEIGKFLLMATKCNPTVLETFLAPQVIEDKEGKWVKGEWVSQSTRWGNKLRSLFPHIWNSTGVMNAFIGYGLNQRKKFFDNKDKRAPKYATAYLRVLYNAWELLSTNTFSVDMRGTEVYDQLKRFKAGEYTHGEVIQACWDMETRVMKAYKENPKKETNLEPINEFLFEVRKEFWK